MFQVSVGIGIDLFIDFLTQIFGRFFICTEPGRRKVFYLYSPDFFISACGRQCVSSGRGTAGNLPGRKLAENLLYNIALAETLLDIFQSEPLQRRNIVLNQREQNSPGREGREKPCLQDGILILGTAEGSNRLIQERSRCASTCDYPPIRRAQTRLSRCRDTIEMLEICSVISGIVMRLGRDLRDEGNVLDLDDLSFFEGFVVLAIGRPRLAFRQRKTQRIERVAPSIPLPFRCLFGASVVLLEIAVGVVTVVVRALVFVEGLGEILRFGFRESSKKYLRDVIRKIVHEKRREGLTIVEVWYRPQDVAAGV